MKKRNDVHGDRATIAKIVSVEAQRYNTIIRDASRSDPAPVSVKLAVLEALAQEMKWMMIEAIRTK